MPVGVPAVSEQQQAVPVAQLAEDVQPGSPRIWVTMRALVRPVIAASALATQIVPSGERYRETAWPRVAAGASRSRRSHSRNRSPHHRGRSGRRRTGSGGRPSPRRWRASRNADVPGEGIVELLDDAAAVVDRQLLPRLGERASSSCGVSQGHTSWKPVWERLAAPPNRPVLAAPFMRCTLSGRATPPARSGTRGRAKRVSPLHQAVAAGQATRLASAYRSSSNDMTACCRRSSPYQSLRPSRNPEIISASSWAAAGVGGRRPDACFGHRPRWPIGRAVVPRCPLRRMASSAVFVAQDRSGGEFRSAADAPRTTGNPCLVLDLVVVGATPGQQNRLVIRCSQARD